MSRASRRNIDDLVICHACIIIPLCLGEYNYEIRTEIFRVSTWCRQAVAINRVRSHSTIAICGIVFSFPPRFLHKASKVTFIARAEPNCDYYYYRGAARTKCRFRAVVIIVIISLSSLASSHYHSRLHRMHARSLLRSAIRIVLIDFS